MPGFHIREAQRLVSELLDREWDPIGVYDLSSEDEPPAGEYETYAGWVVEALQSGGGVEDVLACLQRARVWMGLEAPVETDEPVANLIVDRWLAHP